jgi:HEAT repeat protein
MLRAGCFEDAACGFATLSDAVVWPLLTREFHAGKDPEWRTEILRIAWARRTADALPLLAEALSDPSPLLWKEALDGLVALGSPEARRVLESAMDRPFERPDDADEFRAWVREAVDQITENAAGETTP